MSAGDAHVLPAQVMWAQRKDRVYLTICLEDVQDRQLELTATRLTFSGIGGTERKPHAVTIDFFKEVNPDESKQLVGGREIVMSIRKKESGPYWPRLTADSGKRHWLKTDFNRWLDEDEVEASPFGGGGGDDDNFESMMSQMGGGFGGGGFGGGGFGGDDEDLGDIDGEDGDADEDADGEGEEADGEGEDADGDAVKAVSKEDADGEEKPSASAGAAPAAE